MITAEQVPGFLDNLTAHGQIQGLNDPLRIRVTDLTKLGTSLAISDITLDVVPSSTIQKINVKENNVLTGAVDTLDFVDAAMIAFTTALVAGRVTVTAAVIEAALTLNNIGGTLSVSKGGTGVTTITGIIKGSGTSAFSAATAGTDYVSPLYANLLNGFRLTLTSGSPVTQTDVTAATTIYCTPFTSNIIALYDGSAWNIRTSAEFSLALGTLTANLPYDVFCYDNAGVPTLEFLAWSTATARATALTRQDGVLVKTGAVTRRYIGTFYTISTTTTEDSFANRVLYNEYNRIRKSLRSLDASARTTTSTTFVQVGSVQVAFVTNGYDGQEWIGKTQMRNATAGNLSILSIGSGATTEATGACLGADAQLATACVSATLSEHNAPGYYQRFLIFRSPSATTNTADGSVGGSNSTVLEGSVWV